MREKEPIGTRRKLYYMVPRVKHKSTTRGDDPRLTSQWYSPAFGLWYTEGAVPGPMLR